MTQCDVLVAIGSSRRITSSGVGTVSRDLNASDVDGLIRKRCVVPV